MRTRLLATLALAVFVSGSAALKGQSISASITGAVKDPTGRAVPGAAVTIQNERTGAERRLVSDEAGNFTAPNLEPSVYRLKVQMAGFKTFEKQNIALPASERLVVGDILLEVGSQAESITVRAEGASVQTASAERSGVLTGTQVDALLLKGRSIYSMLALMPGIQDIREEEQPNFVWGILSNGGRMTTTDISLDGISTVNMIENRSSTVDVSMDSVAEVKVMQGVFQAEYGRMAGANVQIVSKSGTKDFHGMVSFFKRHEQFNATPFFNNRNGLPKPRYRFNSWNYNAGGPVILPGTGFNKNRDKLFFFWSQEFWPTTQSTTGYLTTPTAAERAGDFSQSFDLNGRLIQVLDPTSRVPLPDNRMPASILNRSGLALLKMFPEPNFLDVAISARRYNYVIDRPAERRFRSQTLKLNYNLNANHMFSTNWSMRTDPRSGYFGLIHYTSNSFPQMPAEETNRGYAVVTRYNAVFRPTLLNEVNVGITQQLMKTFASEAQMKSNRRDTVGFVAGQINPASNPMNLIPDATFGGLTGAASLGIDYRFPEILSQPQYQVNDTLTWMAGGHMFKAGAMWAYMPADETGYTYYRGRLDYGTNVNNPLDSRHPYANALFGIYNSYTEESKLPRYTPRIPSFEWFVQDTWKTTSRLTLDYGIRFHWMPFPYERDGFISGFDPGRWQAAKAPQLVMPTLSGGQRRGRNPITGEILPATLIGALVPNSGDPANGMASPKDSGYPRGLVEDRSVMLGPRIGFAYDVFGNGKTAVRGGAAIFYNRPFGYDVVRSLVMQAPQVSTQTLYFGYVDSIASSRGYTFPVSVFGMDRTAKIPTTYNLTFSVQQNMGFGTVLDVAYVGSLSRHLEWWMHNNEVPLGANFLPQNADPASPATPLPANFLRPKSGYINVQMYEWNGSSNYHSLQMSANRRFARNLQFGAAWTWSKTMAPNTWDRESISRLVDFNQWYRGLSGNDMTHMFKANWVYQAPRAPGALGTHPVAKHVFNGWQISGIASFISGQPTGVGWSSTVPVDNTGSPSLGSRIDATASPMLAKSERTFYRNFKTEVFRMPAKGSIGNTPKYYLRRPGVNNWDIAFFKDFFLREPDVRAQLRWETYNTFNHTQFSSFDTGARFDPQGNQVNAQFGAYTGARNPRIMQASLRFYF